ncbi:MAG TPA: TIGR03621 family F420-dependent LLM class oxidoreductase [Acidimicrobiales bacterium]|nr:TIGR03621 family F420-dependent LLM class oxidoreductase [Acidimicrobiales bacterium]
MANSRPFKFGAKATKASSGKEWADLARQAEDLGYVSFQIDDHFGSQLAPLPAAMAAAAATTTIRVGPLVAGNDFRNPVVLAKEAATIDLLSDGRFTLGVGAGWLKQDYDVAGIHQADASTRIERLSEAVQIFRGVWSGEPFSFSGKHYSVAETTGYPKPVSRIPILIGGGGRKVLSLAAQQADIVGINPKIVARSINPRSMATAAADVVDEKLSYVKEAAGDRFDALELQLQVFVTVVTDDPTPVAEKLAPAFGLTPELVLQAPYFQIGTVARIKENLQELRERWGISYIAFQGDATQAMAPVVADLSGT